MKKLVFITGIPRSGTSLTYNVITHGFPKLWAGDSERPARRMLLEKRNAICKRPLDIAVWPEIVAMAEEREIALKTVFCIRDPRDVVVSRHPLVGPPHYFLGWDTRMHTGGSGRNPAKFKWEWRPQGIDILYDNLPKVMNASFHIRYETLTCTPRVYEAGLSEYIEEDVSNPFDTHHGGDSSRQINAGISRGPINSNRVGRWRLEEHRERIRKEFAHPEMREIVKLYGYEKDDSWYYRDYWDGGDA